MHSATFDSDGVRLHYVVSGEGKPIVLVHGFAASLEYNWIRPGWFETLAPLRSVVALDCRGHGESEKPHESSGYGWEAMADDVVRLMDHLEIERADLFGYSMGAAISLRALLRHPGRFDSAILGGIGDVLVTRGGRPELAAGLLADDPAMITDPVAKGFRVFAEATQADLQALAALQQAPRTPIDPASLAELRLPVLVVVGEDDALAGSVDGLVAAIPGARLVKVPDREHLTVVGDQRFKDAVVQFLTVSTPA